MNPNSIDPDQVRPNAPGCGVETDEHGVAQSECFVPRESEPLASGDVDVKS
jgi:hypothetical protein